jgi:hypothetical protein
MDLKKLQQVSVILRILNDENLDLYDKCITQISKTCVEVKDSSSFPIEGFIKKDKLVNSPDPQSRFSFPEEPSPAASSIYTFDAIIQDLPAVDLSKSTLFLNIGKGDTLTHPAGLIYSLVSQALAENFTLKISSYYLFQNKLVPYVENLAPISCMQDVEAFWQTDYFNMKKCKEIFVCTTIEIEKNNMSKMFQFIDVLQVGRITELIGKLMTNVEDCEKLQGEENILDLIGGCLPLATKIYCIGNILPMQPYLQQNKYMLNYLEAIYNNKRLIDTVFTKTILKEFRKVWGKNREMAKSLESMRIRLDEMTEKHERNELENSSLKEKISQFRKDAELDRLVKELNMCKESYLFKLAEIAELQQKIAELSEINDGARTLIEKRPPDLLFYPQAKQLDFSKTVLSQDIGISPIRSIQSTEKNAMDRIESLNAELDNVKAELKLMHDKETLMNFTVPRDGIQHLQYYELITGLWRLVDGIRMHAKDVVQHCHSNYKLKYDILERRDTLLRAKIARQQKIHLEKLKEFEIKEKEFLSERVKFQETDRSYALLKDEHFKVSNEMSRFKMECKEKMRKARADIDLRKTLEECEKELEKVKGERDEMQKVCEDDKIKFIARWNEEKKELLSGHEKEKKMLMGNIEMLKEMRQPLLRSGKSDSSIV